MTDEQLQTIDRVLKSAAAIKSPNWGDYSRLKRELEASGIFDSTTLRRLADALRI